MQGASAVTQPRIGASAASASCIAARRGGMASGASCQPFLDHGGEQPRHLVVHPAHEARAGELPVLPEMAQLPGQPGLVAKARGGVGEQREGPRHRLQMDVLGALIMFVEGRAADIGLGDDVGDADILALAEREMIERRDQRGPGPRHPPVHARRHRHAPGQNRHIVR